MFYSSYYTILEYLHWIANFNRLLGQHIGETAESPLMDPCLPTDLSDEIGLSTERLYLRGTGDFDQCRQILLPFLNLTNENQTSLSGIYQPAIDYSNSQFYGFSEFFYCMEDVLRMGGDYSASKYTRAAKVDAQHQTSTTPQNHDIMNPTVIWTGFQHCPFTLYTRYATPGAFKCCQMPSVERLCITSSWQFYKK